MIYNKILEKSKANKKMFALLIDPDKYQGETLLRTIDAANKVNVDFFLIGGSLVNYYIEGTVEIIKKNSTIPIILYPGSLLQISEKADAMFLLSLISGRNPDLLIGNHVLAAPILKKSGLEIISTGYMLIKGSHTTSVEYISNTFPIPANKPDIAVATAMAGEMLGFKILYLEAGSGAEQPVDETIISEVKKNISLPLIVGGGIRTKVDLLKVYDAGADIVVVGTAVEHDISVLKDMADIIQRY